ncbi:MAG: hypothetical protein Q8P02_05075, partial [Candidatus Micrarchaeota archaeon]|nr:hypothetical protein [Candidatus Micrarchaeota archaeon]
MRPYLAVFVFAALLGAGCLDDVGNLLRPEPTNTPITAATPTPAIPEPSTLPLAASSTPLATLSSHTPTPTPVPTPAPTASAGIRMTVGQEKKASNGMTVRLTDISPPTGFPNSTPRPAFQIFSADGL